MRRVLVVIVLMALATVSDAHDLGEIGKVTVIDRDSGTALVPHLYRGEYWIAGVPGAHYAIEVKNRLGERLLAVTSVDGVNVLSGETAAWDQGGYVLDPDDEYQIKGWRKSDTEVAAFTFTSLPHSYAARTGRAANVGVIGVALFREQLPPPRIALGDTGRDGREGGVQLPSTSSALAEAQAPLPEPSPQAAAAASREEVVTTGQRMEKSQVPARAVPEVRLGTGHGAREFSYTAHTEFARLQPQPNELIRIRYDSLENLVAMGIIPRPAPALPKPPTAEPFPGSPNPRYVPDPPG